MKTPPENNSEIFCRSCGTRKPKTEFYKTPTGKTKKPCAECKRAYARQAGKGRYQKDPAASKARFLRWRQRHPEKFREIMRKAMARRRRRRREFGTPELGLAATPLGGGAA